MTNQEILAFVSKLDRATAFASVFGPLAFGGIRRKLKFLERSFEQLRATINPDTLPDELKPVAAAASAKLEALYQAARAAVAEGTYETSFTASTHAPKLLLHQEIQTVSGFFGREAELLLIEKALWDQGGRAALTNPTSSTAVTGLGGVGKSSLAQEYAWRNRARYRGVWWIRAESRDTLLDDLIELGSEFVAGLKDVADRREAAGTALRTIAELGRAKPWLLVYDNVEAPHDIENLCPAGGAHILITSRWANWYGNAVELAVEVFPRPVAVAYLMARARQPDDEEAGRLADALGCLPLALAHARAYCWDMKWGFDRYREKLPQLIRKAPRRAAYPATVHATFELALEGAVAHCPEAERLMGLFAVLAPERIPTSIIGKSAMSEIELGEAVAALAEVSLVKIDKLDDGAPALSVHRLVQEVMRARLAVQGRQEATVALLADSLSYGFNSGDASNWPAWMRLMPHAQAIFPSAPETGKAAQNTAMLLKHSALYCKARAEYGLAEAQFCRALAIAETTLGPEHEDVSFILNDFSILLTELERFSEAEQLISRALAIEELIRGPNHAGVAIRLNNLASVYHEQGRSAEAERLFKRSIAIEETDAGGDSPRLSTRLCNLGRVLTVQGRYDEAEELYRRSLAAAEKARGPNHLDVANRLTNLGYLLMKTNRIREAEAAYRRALDIEESTLGPHHPYVADELANLASVLAATDRPNQAEPLLGRAVAIIEATLPAGHTWIAHRRRQLADLQAKLGNGASTGPAAKVGDVALASKDT
jgi:tetratricopeptide (TPR) repeat protein